jgi:hypothetical protein
MQAIMIKFAWVFYTLMGVSGVEALTAAASPFIGQVRHLDYLSLHQRSFWIYLFCLLR